MKPFRVFVDTNVLVGFVLDRKPFSVDTDKLFRLRDEDKVTIHVSTLTLCTISYFADQHKLDTFGIIGKFLYWFNVVALEVILFEQVLNSGFTDFEDGLQYFSAVKAANIQAIITRNEGDFIHSKIPVMSPSKFLAGLK